MECYFDNVYIIPVFTFAISILQLHKGKRKSALNIIIKYMINSSISRNLPVDILHFIYVNSYICFNLHFFCSKMQPEFYILKFVCLYYNNQTLIMK